MRTIASLAVALVGGLWSGPACAEGPLPMRQIAPESTYVLVAADAWNRALEAWKGTGVHALLQEEPLKGIMGAEGAEGAMAKRVKELGAPEGAASFPDAFGVALYTSHNNELDTDEAHILIYGDWGARADAFGQLVDAVLADAVRKDGWKTEAEDDIAGRKVTGIRIPPNARDRAMKEQFEGLGIEFSATRELFHYLRDGSRFFVCTERSGLEDVLDVVDGKRKSAFQESRDFQAAMDQLGTQDLAAVLLTGPLQKTLAGEGAGMLSLLQPMIQPLFGDVLAWSLGARIGGQADRQIELTQGVLVPGQKAGVWKLLGPSMPIEPPPPMIGPEAISYGRMNVQFKEIMGLVNSMAASVPEVGDMLDPWLLNFGPVVSKGLEALGPGVWMSSEIRQPVTPESLVGSTIVACSNPKAVVPMLTQLGAAASMEPRDVDGNTIFAGKGLPVSIGVANGYMAYGDTRQVENAMRALGQKDLHSVSENISYKRAARSVGGESLVGWGYADLVARWRFDREIMRTAGKESGVIARTVDRADESTWAGRVGYRVPDDANERLATLEPETLARFIGPLVWTSAMGEKGLVTRAGLMPAAPAAE
jgi:hypothetical protein